MALIYAAGDEQETPNLGLSTWGMDKVTAQNFIILDAAFVSLPAAIDVNGVAVPSANFVNSASVIFAVVGSNITATAASGVFAQTKAAVASNWLNSYNALTGLFTATQPTYADI